MSTVERITAKARELPPEKQKEVLDFIEFLGSRGTARRPLRDVYGLWKGVTVSAEDIDEVRREMWHGFPRDDF